MTLGWEGVGWPEKGTCNKGRAQSILHFPSNTNMSTPSVHSFTCPNQLSGHLSGLVVPGGADLSAQAPLAAAARPHVPLPQRAAHGRRVGGAPRRQRWAAALGGTDRGFPHRLSGWDWDRFKLRISKTSRKAGVYVQVPFCSCKCQHIGMSVCSTLGHEAHQFVQAPTVRKRTCGSILGLNKGPTGK